MASLQPKLSGLKKTGDYSLSARRQWIEPGHAALTLEEQLHLAGVSKTAYYYEPAKESKDNLLYMNLIDALYTEHPYYGSRRMTVEMGRRGYGVNRKRVIRLMHLMGLKALYPKPKLSTASRESQKYPYLLDGFKPSRPNEVWSTDITYIPVKGGFLYLVAIIDWFSRYVTAWRLSNSLDTRFCIEAVSEAFELGVPEIFNSDQGVQFTSKEFTGMLEERGIAISMDGRGRAFDNIFVERLWRTVKYEEVYIKKYETGLRAQSGLSAYFPFYNERRPHQALGYKTPYEVHFG